MNESRTEMRNAEGLNEERKPAAAPGPQSTLNLHAKQVIESVQNELNQLFRERSELMKRIGTVRQTLLCLANMFGQDQLAPEVLRMVGRSAPERERGLTRACRVILMEAVAPLEARQGLQELQRRFPHLIEHHKDPLASITTIFNRLVRSGEARSSDGYAGRRVWEWVAAPRSAETNLSLAVEENPTTPETIIKQ